MIIKGFLGPFIVTFMIALFVLTMQFLWLWIDDLVGKGVGIMIIFELLFYLILSFFPIALPIAILLSSVMVMGGYAERYELSSMNSAGISLMRIIRPMFVFAFGVAILSFACSNYLWPIANLQYRSRLLDIRNQKPTLSIQEGVFNNEFSGFSLRVGKKKSDNKTISDVLIYDYSNFQDNLNMMTAQQGEMYTDEKDGLFVMKLFDGYQYQEGIQNAQNQRGYPFIRTNFKEYTKVFDLSQFDFTRSDQDLYKSHYTMLNIKQLKVFADSIESRQHLSIGNIEKMLEQEISLSRNNNRNIEFQSDARFAETVIQNNQTDSYRNNHVSKNIVGKLKDTVVSSGPKEKMNRIFTNVQLERLNDQINKNNLSKEKDEKISVADVIDLNEAKGSWFDMVAPRFKAPVKAAALEKIRSFNGSLDLEARVYESEQGNRVKYIFEMNNKFAFAVICIVFLFIGAPMGAIVRKGGFGFPLLISIVFFMIFQVLFTAFKKSSDSLAIQPMVAAWMPNLLLIPLAGFITYNAVVGKSFINTTRFTASIVRGYQWVAIRINRIVQGNKKAEV